MKEALFEGVSYAFPDDATPEEMTSAMNKLYGKKPEPSWTEVIKAIPGTALGQAQVGIGGAVEAVGDLLRQPSMSEAGAGIAESGRINVQEAQPPGEMPFWKRAVVSGISSVAQQAPTLAASILTMNPLPALAGAAGMAGGSTYSETRKAGFGGARSAVHAGVDAAAEAVLELIPTKFLLKSASEGAGISKMIMGLYLREVPTEILTTAVNQANARLSINPDLTAEEFWQSIADTVGSTMVAAPVTAGLAKGVSLVAPGQKAETPAPAPAPIPESELPVVDLPGAETKNVPVNSALIDPKTVETTLVPDSTTKEAMLQQFLAIDPDKLDEKQVEAARKVLEDDQKATEDPPDPQAELSWTPLSAAPKGSVDVGELSATQKQADNAANYLNPNQGERLDRNFSFATDAEAVGRTPRQVRPKAGVYVLGKPTVDRPEAVLKSMMDTVEEWRKRWLPNATIILSNEQLLTNSALGWHYSMGDGKHLIVPAVLRKLTDPSKFNVNTQAGAFYNLAHEFGHALVKDRFYEGTTPESAVLVANQSKVGVVAPEALATLPELQRKVVEEYNAIRQRIIDGSMNAEELLRVWFGPAKAGRNFLGELKVAGSAPALEVGIALADRAARNSAIQDEISSQQFRAKMLEDVFSLDEYLAEQMSRYAYSRNLDQSSALGKFLKGALESLRKFFAQLKAESVIAPGTAFGEWLDSLPQISRLAEEKHHLASAKKNAGKKKEVNAKEKQASAPKVAAASPKVKKAVKKAEHQVRASTKAEFAKKAKGMINLLVRDGTLDKGSQLHEEALNLIDNNHRDEFFDLIREVTGKTVKFEIDGQDEKKVSQSREWRPDRFRGPQFKAWFGDWERNPGNSSVVRIGAFEEMQDGKLVIKNQDSAPPLVSFMSADRLAKGEIYYASTLRGAHYVESQSSQTLSGPSSGKFVPVVLNIRNPYVVTHDSLETPNASEVKAQGFDGIVYRNSLDGDITFVAFSPEQVKIVDDRGAYSGLQGVSMELDVDQATPTGRGVSRVLNSLGGFMGDKSATRRALRRVVHHPDKLLQIQQLAHVNPLIQELSFFNQVNVEYNTYGAGRRREPDRILQYWERMAKRNKETVSKVLLDEFEGGEHWFELYYHTKDQPNPKIRNGVTLDWYRFRMTDKAKQELKARGIDTDTALGAELAAHILDVKNSLLDSLNEDEMVLFELASHRYGHKPNALTASQTEIRWKIHQQRKTPFFPQARFGNMMLLIEEKTVDGWQQRWKQSFESEKEFEEAYQRALSSKQPNERVEKKYLKDREYVLMSLPKDFLSVVASELDLSEDEIKVLERIARPVKHDRLLKTYELSKRGLKGYSTDTLRSYSHFTWHHSNAQAKLLHAARFDLALDGVREQKRQLEKSQQPDLPALRKLNQIVSAMEAAKDYIMSPPNEMQTARGLVSLVYLGLNVKTAVINLYGLITVWSDMIGKYGFLSAQKRLFDAARYSALSMKLTDLNDRRKGNYLPPNIQKMLDQAIEEGVLSQSYAYHLAGAANSSNLARMPGYQYTSRIWQHTVDVGMYPFRLMELATRRIAFIAAAQEQLEKNPDAPAEAYRRAVEQVNILQNDYSLGNRVPFMRGGPGLRSIVPLATIFMSFAQHMAFHGYGGYELGTRRKKQVLLQERFEAGEITAEQLAKMSPKWFEWGYGYTARIWLLTLLVAGYEGLPGMENILDLIEVIWRKIGKKPMRQELREMVQAVGGDPVAWSRGLSHDVFGFDISRSVGFGRLVPGTDVLTRGKDQSAEELAGGLAFNLMGPTGGLLKFGFSAVGDDKAWGEKLQKLPGGVGNIWNAYYWSTRGVLGPSEGQITLEKQPDGSLKPRELTGVEIAGKALGFNPEIVARNREILWNSYDLKMYWRSKQSSLLTQHWDAVRQNDPEALADVKKAISEFNADLGDDPEHKKLRITPKQLANSIKIHRRNLKREERGLPPEKKYEGIYGDVRGSYDPGGSSP